MTLAFSLVSNDRLQSLTELEVDHKLLAEKSRKLVSENQHLREQLQLSKSATRGGGTGSDDEAESDDEHVDGAAGGTGANCCCHDEVSDNQNREGTPVLFAPPLIEEVTPIDTTLKGKLTNELILSSISKSNKNNAKSLLARMDKNARISWDLIGSVFIDGTKLEGNIIELLKGIHSRKVEIQPSVKAFRDAMIMLGVMRKPRGKSVEGKGVAKGAKVRRFPFYFIGPGKGSLPILSKYI